MSLPSKAGQCCYWFGWEALSWGVYGWVCGSVCDSESGCFQFDFGSGSDSESDSCRHRPPRRDPSCGHGFGFGFGFGCGCEYDRA